MNERQAIEFIMQEIKEQRRADHEMYLDMRKQTTETYHRFLDRLRELDEREANSKAPIKEKQQQPKEEAKWEPNLATSREIRDIFKTLPLAPSAHMTQSEMRVDRIEVEEERSNQKRTEDVLPYVVDYLKHADGSEPLRDIQYYVESEMNHKWVNFSIVMTNLMTLDPCIQRSKVRGYYIYKEV